MATKVYGEFSNHATLSKNLFFCYCRQHQNTGGILIHHGSTLVRLCGATSTLMATTAQTLMTLCGVAMSAPTQ